MKWLESVEGYPVIDWSDGKPPATFEEEIIGKLDANENLFLPRSFLHGIVRQVVRETDVNIYPTNEYYELANAISKYVKVPVQNVALGSGSDQIIDLLISSFLSPGDRLLTTKPGFSWYRVRGAFRGFSTIEVPLGENFEFTAEKMLAKSGDTRVAFVDSPNNPTGAQFDRAELERLVEQYPGLVVLDEAYAEFAKETLIELTSKYDNLVVLRTFSKAFGLAGFRVGYMVANARVARMFRLKVQYVYGINALGVRVAKKALENLRPIRKAVAGMKRERAWMFKQLSKIEGIRVWPSQANFHFVLVYRNTDAVKKQLAKRCLLAREFSAEDPSQTYLRVTLAKRTVNERVLQALETGLGS